MDMNMNSSLGYEEFIIFLACIKMIQWKCNEDMNFKRKIVMKSNFESPKDDLWKVAMQEVNTWAINATWKIIVDFVDRKIGDDLEDKVTQFFNDVFDDNVYCEEEEALFGLRRCGVNITKQQMNVLFRSMDIDGNHVLDLHEFIIAFKKKKKVLKGNGQMLLSAERDVKSKEERIRAIKSEMAKMSSELALLENEIRDNHQAPLRKSKSPSVL